MIAGNFAVGARPRTKRRRPVYSECLFLSLQHGPERHTKVLVPASVRGRCHVNIVLVGQVLFYLDEAVRERHLIETRPLKEIVRELL
ncbi:MAG: hypothetical protein JO162_06225 [Alphaproteobacteria bacterium]|nr:hypothetical protein [Alphaproteobacteria bacterium]